MIAPERKLRIGFSTGYGDFNYWGTDWFNAKQIGGSEHLLTEVACELARQGHEVSVRLPYPSHALAHRGVLWLGQEAEAQRYDLLFCFDDHARRDRADRTALVVCRSDPPPTTNFDELLFLSAHHARFLGHAGRPHVGGGVNLADYEGEVKRTKGLVLCTSSPDRCQAAFQIGAAFPRFVFTYKPVPGLPPTRQVSRADLVKLQREAQVLIYPYDPRRESDFFSMAILEAMAAGTPCVIADGESHVELWGDAAVVLPRPVRLAEWVETVEDILGESRRWKRLSEAGRACARGYAWDVVARKYLTAAGL